MKLHLPGGKTITIDHRKWIVLEFESRAEKDSMTDCLSTPSNLVGLFSDDITSHGAERILSKVEKKV
jgi:hypothetical protein